MSCNQEDVKNMKALIKEIGLENDTKFIAKGCNENYKTCKSCRWGEDDDYTGDLYKFNESGLYRICLLYTSDAADDS